MPQRPPTDAAFDLSGASPWRTEGTSVLFEDQRLRIRRDRVVQPDGQVGTYTLVELRGPVVAVVPIADDQVYLVRQWRYPWGQNSWEIPAGHCEDGEDPLAAAQRELAEEVGVEAADWQPLGEVRASAIVTGRYVLYLARALAPTGQRAREGSEQDLIARPVPLKTAVAAAMDGRIVHAVSVVGLLRAARILGL